MRNEKKQPNKRALFTLVLVIGFQYIYAQTGITVNNPTGTISSSTGKISLATDTLTTSGDINTTGTVRANNLNLSGSLNATGNITVNGSISFPHDTIGDTNLHIMSIDKHGNLTPLKSSSVNSVLFPSLHPSSGPCSGTSVPEIWQFQAPTIFSPGVLNSTPCQLVGVGISTPDAAFTVSNSSQTPQLSVYNQTSSTDVFSVDYIGNTAMSGAATITNYTYIGTPPYTSYLGMLSVTSPPTTGGHSYYSALLVQPDTSTTYGVIIGSADTTKLALGVKYTPAARDYFQLYRNGDIYTAGKMQVGNGRNSADAGLCVSNTSSYKQFSVFNPTYYYDVFTIDKKGNTALHGTMRLGKDSADWTTYSGSPYGSATGGGWNVPLIIPNGSAIRTATKGTLGRYLGFGMVDNPTASNGGWYWMVEGDTTSSAHACYPMALTLDGGGNATLTLSQNGWCDYVFNNAYAPMSIAEKEKFYKTNKHLPGIDSAEVVLDKGLNINKNMKGMLQNLEEDRLDITALSKLIQQQNTEIEELKKEVAQLKEQK